MTNDELQEAIREELGRHVRREVGNTGVTRQVTITALLVKRSKLLQLHYDDRITADAFAAEEGRLTAQIESLRTEASQVEAELVRRDE